MDSERPLCGFCKLQKALDDFKRRHTAIGKVEFVMCNSVFNKLIGLISLIVEADYCLHS